MSLPAYFWNGDKQLAGHLTLGKRGLQFTFQDFVNSHLNLEIAYADIEQLEVFLVFDVGKYGLRILSKEGKQDCFIVEDPQALKHQIEAAQAGA